MKITFIKKATNAKPMMSCPVLIDDSALSKQVVEPNRGDLIQQDWRAGAA